jgi:hypothetical protein
MNYPFLTVFYTNTMYTCWVRSYFSLFFLVFPRIIRRFSIPDNSWPSWTKSQPWKPQQLDFARRGFRFGLPGVPGVGSRCRHVSRFLDRNFSTFSIHLDPGCESAPVESALENNSCFGFPISRILVLSNPDTKLVLIR